MPRKLRVQYPGAIYHVMNRGDRRDAIFAEAEAEDGGPVPGQCERQRARPGMSVGVTRVEQGVKCWRA